MQEHPFQSGPKRPHSASRYPAIVRVGLLWLGLAAATNAFSIDQVTVLPGSRCVFGSAVSLQVAITTPSAAAFLYQPTSVTVTGTRIEVDIFPDSGMFTVLDSLIESVPLGALPVGQYDYEVRLNPRWSVGWGNRAANGTFSVESSRRPDLFQFGVSPRFTPARVEPGGNLRVRWSVHNNGTMGIPEDPPSAEVFGPAVGPWEEAVLLAGNGATILLGRRTFNGVLNPLQSHSFDEVFPIPAGVLPGFYRIAVRSDYLDGQAAGSVPEANEANNSGEAEFTVKVVRNVASEPVLAIESLQPLGSGRRKLVLRGEAGRCFQMQVSSTLTNWTTVATLANPDGIVSWSDYTGGVPQRFYRAAWLP